MGIETVAIATLAASSIASSFSSYAQGKAEVEQARNESAAIKEQADIESENRAEQATQQASSAKVSFINSGLTLEGTPAAAITGILDAGIEDLDLIKRNAEMQQQNRLAQARNRAISGAIDSTSRTLSSLASFGSSSFMGSSGGSSSSGFVPTPVLRSSVTQGPSYTAPQLG